MITEGKVTDIMFTLDFLYYEGHIDKEKKEEILKLIKSPDKENLVMAELLLENYKISNNEGKP